MSDLNVFQDAFIRKIQLLAEPIPQREEIYRDHYFARVSTTLVQTVLSPLVSLWGEEYLMEWLGRYLSMCRSREADIIENIKGFGTFLGAFEQEYPERADLVELAWLRWKLLVGPDPENELLHSNRLSWRIKPTSAAYHSNYPLLALWQNKELDFSETTSILLVKTDAESIVMLNIPETMVVLIEHLLSGMNLRESIESMEIHSVAVVPEQLQEWIEVLTRLKVWTSD